MTLDSGYDEQHSIAMGTFSQIVAKGESIRSTLQSTRALQEGLKVGNELLIGGPRNHRSPTTATKYCKPWPTRNKGN